MTPSTSSRAQQIPAWVRWAAFVWLAVWIPAYWKTWGAANFLHLCDVAVFFTCAGLLSSNSLLLSSQAVSSIMVDMLWCLDVAWRLLFSRHLFGGTEYLWDAGHPLWVRLLSSFHLILPALLVWGVIRVGYDRRGIWLQTAIAAAVMIASRLAPAAKNINYAWTAPILHRALGPAPVHLFVIFTVLVAVMYWPTHYVLARMIPPPHERA